MRVGIVIGRFERSRGGLEEWCWQFASALAARNHEVHVVTEGIATDQSPERVACHPMPTTGSRFAFAILAEQKLRQLSLDVVHDMGAGLYCDVFQPHGGTRFALIERRGHMYPEWFRYLKGYVDAVLPRRRAIMQYCERQFTAGKKSGRVFVALSNSVAQDFIRFHQVPAEQIAVVYNGVDCKRFSPEHRAEYRNITRQRMGVGDDRVLFFLAAHNFRLKGLRELLQVVVRLAANGRPVHLAVAGRACLGSWNRIVSSHGLTGRVTFLGPVKDIVPYYAAADVYVHPTYYDPCSLVLLESAASGLPIITTRRSNGAAELFRDGSDALLVDNPKAHDELYASAEALFDEQLRHELGTAARQVALRNPFERNVSEIVRLYEQRLPSRLVA